MPIKGLTDRDSLTPRFPRIGKLRKGGEKTTKGFGPDLDHFRFTSDRPDAMAAFVAAYGESPRQINCYLPYATADENFPTWKEAWKAGGLQHRCDGQTCTIWLGADGKYHREPKPCPGGCDEIGRLEIIIPEMLEAGFVGTVAMETHSLNDMMSIMAALVNVSEMRGDNPLGLRGIMFTLRRVPEKISTPGWGENKGQRQRVEKWLVKIEPAVDWVTAQMALQREGAMPALTQDNDVIDGELVETPDAKIKSAQDALYPPAQERVITTEASRPAVHPISDEHDRKMEESKQDDDMEQAMELEVTSVVVAKTAQGKPYLSFVGEGGRFAPWWKGRTALHKAAPWIELTDDQLAVAGAKYDLPIGTVAVLVANGKKNIDSFKRVIKAGADGLAERASRLLAVAEEAGIELPPYPDGGDDATLATWLAVAEAAAMEHQNAQKKEVDF